MAITQNDGSIILSTKVDTSGINKGMSSMTRTLGRLASALGLAFSINQIIRFSNVSGKLTTQTEASVQRLVDIYGSASNIVGDFIDENARALGMSKSAAASFSSVYGNLFSVWADQKTNAELTNQYLNMTAVVASKTGKTVEDVQERVRSGLLGNTEAIEDLGVFVNIKTIEMTDAFKRMANGKTWEQLDGYTQQQIRTIAILEQATAKYGDEVANNSAIIRNNFNAAYQDFQNSWGNIVNQVLLPALQVLTEIFNMATTGLNALTGRSGKILEDAKTTTNASSKTSENINKQTKNQKSLNNEVKKTLAGFDDIQILSSKTSENINSDNDSVNLFSTTNSTSESKEPNTNKYQEIATAIKNTLADILVAASAALLAVGLIMLFSGNIVGGIGLITAGATAFISGDSLGSENPIETLKGHLKALDEIIIPALLGIGVLMLFAGAIPLGIGLIIGGIAYWGYKEVQSKEYDTASLQDKLNVIMEAVSLGLVAIGVLLIFFGHIPLGIGLIIGGKKLLGITEEKIEEGGVTTKIQKFIDDNSSLIVGVGIALTVIALILLACGVFSPLSLGLLVAGGATLATAEEMNPGIIKETITNFFKENATLITGVGIALVILGIILLFTGAGVPLGIGLIIAGGASLATTAVLNWDFIIDKLGEIWDKIKKFWNTYIAPIFTAAWWLNLAKKAGNGLISGFESAINGIITMFENMINWVVNGINKISFDIPDWLGGGHFGFNIPNVKFNRVSIPRLAKGAVIPANKEFLAILGDQKHGTNIEAPLSTIEEAVENVLNRMGMGGSSEVVKEEIYNLSETELMRIIYKLVKGGERLQGERLVKA